MNIRCFSASTCGARTSVISKSVLVLVLVLAPVASAGGLVSVESALADEPTATAAGYGTRNPAAPPETAQFDFLVGCWLADITVKRADGSVITAQAEWTIRYILDGRALRDDWFVILEDGSISNHGTMYRSFNVQRGTWTIVEQLTPGLEFEFMTAQQEDDTMVMYEHEHGFDGALTGKRVFFNIKPEHFEWQHYTTRDGGDSWQQGAYMSVARKQ